MIIINNLIVDEKNKKLYTIIENSSKASNCSLCDNSMKNLTKSFFSSEYKCIIELMLHDISINSSNKYSLCDKSRIRFLYSLGTLKSNLFEMRSVYHNSSNNRVVVLSAKNSTSSNNYIKNVLSVPSIFYLLLIINNLIK